MLISYFLLLEISYSFSCFSDSLGTPIFFIYFCCKYQGVCGMTLADC
nr:MAG TPA: hypothetical protein [Caudoviricetes sp.]